MNVFIKTNFRPKLFLYIHQVKPVHEQNTQIFKSGNSWFSLEMILPMIALLSFPLFGSGHVSMKIRSNFPKTTPRRGGAGPTDPICGRTQNQELPSLCSFLGKTFVFRSCGSFLPLLDVHTLSPLPSPLPRAVETQLGQTLQSASQVQSLHLQVEVDRRGDPVCPREEVSPSLEFRAVRLGNPGHT